MSGVAARREHPDWGIREEVGFFGDPAMFGITHLPTDPTSLGVVICPTVHAELFRSYRKEVLLGRALARAGIAAQRFHYPGAGNSYGDPDELTVEAMVTAVGAAVDHLHHRYGVERIALAGTRIGAFAAVEAADAVTPLLLWDPVADGTAFLGEVVRSHQIAALKGTRSQPSSGVRQQLDDQGAVELLGYEFPKALYDSISGRKLEEITPEGPVHVVPFGSGARVRRLADHWEQEGADVTVPDLTQPAAWWLIGTELTSEDGDDATRQLVDDAVSWLRSHLVD